MKQITCNIIQDLLPLYCENICSSDSKEATEEHLEQCSECSLEYAKMKNKVVISTEAMTKNKAEGEKVMEFSGFIENTKKDAHKKGLLTGLGVALLVSLVAFYVMPLFIVDTGSGMFMLLVAIPAFCFVSALIYGSIAGFKWFYPILSAVLYIPAIFIYFNPSAFIYVFIFGITALIGNAIGGIIHKTLKKYF